MENLSAGGPNLGDKFPGLVSKQMTVKNDAYRLNRRWQSFVLDLATDMNPRQKQIVLGLVIFAVLCWLTAPFWGGIERMDASASRAPLRADADQAYRITKEFVTKNPKRVLGSIEARQATGYLRNSLKGLGYLLSSPTYFDAMIAGRRQAGSNIVAYKAGMLPEILVLMAHYDTARTTVQGAMDDGSGIGIMLELAREFASAPLRHSLLIVASDGEEWGMLGAADFGESYPERRRIAAVLSLDRVAIGDFAELQLDTDGQRGGYTPSWLHRIALAAVAAEDLPVTSPAGLEEQLRRAVSLSAADQGPLLRAGIPAINLSSRSTDERRAREVYHSAYDTIENLKTTSFGSYLQAAERILRVLDELPAYPGMDNAFRFRKDTFVADRAMKLLQILTLLPFVAMLIFGWMQYRPSLNVPAALREAVFFLAWLVPFLLLFTMILFCRLMRLYPRSSLYPAPLHDPILEVPAWGAVAIITALSLMIGIGLHFLARHLTRGQPCSFADSKIFLMSLLFVTVFSAWIYDAYWAATFLTFPALIWGAVGRARSGGTRILGALAIAGAGFTLGVLAIYAQNRLGLGWKVVWYGILGLSNGMLSWKGYFLSCCVIVLGLRFLSLQVTHSSE
jgi:hypothetical protein